MIPNISKLVAHLVCQRDGCIYPTEHYAYCSNDPNHPTDQVVIDRWTERWLTVASYTSIEAELKQTPQTWVPALLKTLIARAEELKVFRSGGLLTFVLNNSKDRPL
jgi:hypothetical protein